MVVLCLLAALDNTFIVLKGSMTKTARVVFCSTLLDTISNFLRAHVWTGSWLPIILPKNLRKFFT